MDATVLNRLVAARYLIEQSGPALTTSSPALLLAQKILAAHDAAELVFLALLSFGQRKVLATNGQVVKDPSFYALAEAAIQLASENPSFNVGTNPKLFQDLLEARKLFKHSGLLVDPISNASLFSDIVHSLDAICHAVLGMTFLAVDQTFAVQSKEARSFFVLARESLEKEEYKASLENTAKALSVCFFHSNTPGHLIVGTASSEEALLLSGRGIDPASYLSMQRLLPTTYLFSEECEWELRKFGHSANWTAEKAQFCLQTALDVATKLEATPYKPEAEDFYGHHDDVIELLKDTTISCVTGSLWSLGIIEEHTAHLAGDKIYGRASGHVEKATHVTADNQCDFEFAEWIAIEDAAGLRIPEVKDYTKLVAWIRRDAVKIGYQVNSFRAKLRNNPDKTFEEIQALPDTQ